LNKGGIAGLEGIFNEEKKYKFSLKVKIFLKKLIIGTRK
jgi:hypothetical protein